MVKIRASSGKQFLFCMTALCSQLPVENKTLFPEIPDSYLSNQISKAYKEKLLKHTSTKVGECIRLRAPNGLTALQQISDILYDHYMDLTNEHHFLSRPVEQQRISRLSEVILLCNYASIPTNNLLVTYDKKERGLGHPTPSNRPIIFSPTSITPEYINPRISVGLINKSSLVATNPVFYTSQILKVCDFGFAKSRINFSRFHGLLVSLGGVYPIYHGGTEQSKWQTSPEHETRESIKAHYSCPWGTRAQATQSLGFNGTGEAVFLYSGTKILKSFLDSVDPKNLFASRKLFCPMDPLSIYSDVYLLPVSAKQAHPILKTITLCDWKYRLLRLAFTEDELYTAVTPNYSSYTADAVNEESGTCWFELLSWNLRKLKYAYDGIKNNMYISKADIGSHPLDDQSKMQVGLVCYDWQVEQLSELGLDRNTVHYIIVDPEQVIATLPKLPTAPPPQS